MSVVALFAAAIAAMGVPTGPVGASDDDVDTGVPEEIASLDQELLDTEQDLQDVVERMRAEVAPDDPAFAGIAIDPATNTVTVYRKGAGTSVSASAYRSVPRDGATLRIEDAVISATENVQLNQQLNSDATELERAGVHITSFGSEGRGGPYRIGVTGADTHRAALIARYSRFGPETVEVVEEEPLQTFSRQDDAPPWWGGAEIRPAAQPVGPWGRHWCSSGFGAYSTDTGDDYIISSAHCVNQTDPRFWDGSGQYVGRATAQDLVLDAAYIKVSSSENRIYDGGIGNDFSKQVVGTRSAITGGSVCTSGSASGVRCGGTINTQARWHTFWTTAPGGTSHSYRAWLYEATRADGQALAGVADSGGPVFSLQGGNVVARGIISSGAEDKITTCVGYNWPGRRCTSNVFFGDIESMAILRNLSLTHR